MRKSSRSILMFLLLMAAAGIFAGCATTEPDNMSAIPWNSPKGWESGLPSSLNERR